jgi:hypothetical protein
MPPQRRHINPIILEPIHPEPALQAAPGQPTYAELLQRIQELTDKVNQGALASRLLRKPTNFVGTPNDIAYREVETWLRVIEDFMSASGQEIESNEGIKIVASYLDTNGPRRDYDSHVHANGEFTSYREGFKLWMIQRYSPADPLHTYRDAFEKCYQRIDEPFDAFHSRFIKAHSLLDHPEEAKDLTYKFISHLIPGIVGDVRRDIISYEGLTTQDILAKLKRIYPKGVPSLRPTVPATSVAQRIIDSSNSSRNSVPYYRRYKSNHNHRHGPNPNFRHSRDFASSSTEHTSHNNHFNNTKPLSESEKRWLTENVKRGGGRFIFEHIQNHPEWQQIANKIRACHQCGAIGHRRENCNIKPNPRPDRLNAITTKIRSIPSLFEPGALDHLNLRK